MFFHLYLLRHAQSADKQASQTDQERELTTQGVKESLQIGYYLKSKNFSPDLIYSSPAQRAQTTAQMVSEVLKLEEDRIRIEEELYNASVRTFFNWLNSLDDGYNTVMCVGHNPTLSYVAEYLTGAEIGEMAPAGLVAIEFKQFSWKDISQGNGVLIENINPTTLSLP